MASAVVLQGGGGAERYLDFSFNKQMATGVNFASNEFSVYIPLGFIPARVESYAFVDEEEGYISSWTYRYKRPIIQAWSDLHLGIYPIAQDYFADAWRTSSDDQPEQESVGVFIKSISLDMPLLDQMSGMTSSQRNYLYSLSDDSIDERSSSNDRPNRYDIRAFASLRITVKAEDYHAYETGDYFYGPLFCLFTADKIRMAEGSFSNWRTVSVPRPSEE